MKISTRILTAILLIAGSSTAVYALSRHGGWHMSPEEKVEFVSERVTKKLDLDSSQQQNFNQLANRVAEIMVEARADRANHIDEVFGLLDEPSFNQAQALDLIRQKTDMINEKAPLVISSLAIFLDSLNAEQKAQLREAIEDHRQHRHNH